MLGIVRAHGAILVESEPGEGTRFVVALPQAHRPDPVPRPTEDDASAARELGITVLVVDDEDAVRRSLCNCLAAEGYTVMSASDGPDAIAKLSAPPAAVQAAVVDLTMPHMSGLETIGHLRALAHRLPIVVVSGCADTSDLPALERICFLAKPFRTRELVESLRGLMRERP